MRLYALVILFMGAAVLMACGGSSSDEPPPSGGDVQEVKLLADWFIQPENAAGAVSANLTGAARDNGIAFEMLPGGPQVQTIPQVASGKADFGVANADAVLQARAEGVPIKAVFAPFDRYYAVLLSHTQANVKDIQDVNGKTASVTSFLPYWPWLLKHYDLRPAKVINYTGSLAQFRQDPNMVQQGIATNEPYLADEAGIATNAMWVADLGFNPYSAVVFTTDRKIDSDPETVRSVVHALRAGWASYLSDPQATNDELRELNTELMPGQISYAANVMRDELDPAPSGMSAERWKTLAEQLAEVDALRSELDPADAWTNEFAE